MRRTINRAETRSWVGRAVSAVSAVISATSAADTSRCSSSSRTVLGEVARRAGRLGNRCDLGEVRPVRPQRRFCLLFAVAEPTVVGVLPSVGAVSVLPGGRIPHDLPVPRGVDDSGP
jgi:hypothetical protein